MEISHAELIGLALTLPQTNQHDHFGKPAFRVGTKIFATLHANENRVVLKLSPANQVALCEESPGVFAPVAGAWGSKGWTNVFLQHAPSDILQSSLKLAWREIAPKRLVLEYD